MSLAGTKCRAKRAVGLAAVLAASGAAGLIAGSARTPRMPSPSHELGATVRIEAVGTQRGGATGRPKLTWSRHLNVGQTERAVLVRGADDDSDICNAAFAPSDDANLSATLWTLEVTPLSVSAHGPNVRVRWRKSGSEAAEQTRDLRLTSDDHHVLDYLENRMDGSPCASLLLRLAARPDVPPQSPAPLAAVDLWTVEETGGQPARAIHDRIVAAPGENVPFQMFSLDYPIGEGAKAPTVHVGVGGTLRLTTSSDDTVDIELTVSRKFSFGDDWASGEGRGRLNAARVGETIALTLPPPPPQVSGAFPATGRLLPCATLREGRVSVDLRELLEGRNLALYVRVTRVR